jgi:thiamine-monophosphate kinase
MQKPEFALIDWIRRRCGAHPAVRVGIGDDAAVLQPSGDAPSLVTVDLLMDGVDFLTAEASPFEIGRKALAVNLSDIAAMGGRPLAAFVATALPKARGLAFAQELHRGVLDLANEYKVAIAGGDTNSWNGPLVISITVWGEPIGSRPVLRGGARPGDWVMVTGSCGGSLPSGRHLACVPRCIEAERLVLDGPPSAMIDISDGLAADLHHLLTASGVGAHVNASQIPIHPDAHLWGDDRSALEHALGDGEDFELVWTAAPDVAAGIQRHWPNSLAPLSKIGEITADLGIWLVEANGQRHPLPPLGWSHSLDSASLSPPWSAGALWGNTGDRADGGCQAETDLSTRPPHLT